MNYQNTKDLNDANNVSSIQMKEERKKKNNYIKDIKHEESSNLKKDSENNSGNGNSTHESINEEASHENEIIAENNSNQPIFSVQNEKKVEDNSIMNSLMKELESRKDKFSENEKLMFMVIKEYKKDSEKQKKINEEYSENFHKLEEKVNSLEKHQILLYNQMALFQTSRDNGKRFFFICINILF